MSNWEGGTKVILSQIKASLKFSKIIKPHTAVKSFFKVFKSQWKAHTAVYRLLQGKGGLCGFQQLCGAFVGLFNRCEFSNSWEP